MLGRTRTSVPFCKHLARQSLQEQTCARRGSDCEAASVGPPGKAGLSSLIPTRVGRKGVRREERQGRPCSFTQCSQSEHQRQVVKVSGLGGQGQLMGRLEV